MVGAREEWKSRYLVVMVEGRRVTFFRYDGMETGNARVEGWSCAEVGRKTTSVEAGHWTAGGEVGEAPISIHKNKLGIIGLELPMSEVGTTPPHNSDKPHVLVDYQQQQQKSKIFHWSVHGRTPTFTKFAYHMLMYILYHFICSINVSMCYWTKFQIYLIGILFQWNNFEL